MKVRPIHFVPDLAEAVRFYKALGLRTEAQSRSGHWVELTAGGGELGLHDAAIAADGHGRIGIAQLCCRRAARGGRTAAAQSRLPAGGDDR